MARCLMSILIQGGCAVSDLDKNSKLNTRNVVFKALSHESGQAYWKVTAMTRCRDKLKHFTKSIWRAVGSFVINYLTFRKCTFVWFRYVMCLTTKRRFQNHYMRAKYAQSQKSYFAVASRDRLKMVRNFNRAKRVIKFVQLLSCAYWRRLYIDQCNLGPQGRIISLQWYKLTAVALQLRNLFFD